MSNVLILMMTQTEHTHTHIHRKNSNQMAPRYAFPHKQIFCTRNLDFAKWMNIICPIT